MLLRFPLFLSLSLFSLLHLPVSSITFPLIYLSIFLSSIFLFTLLYPSTPSFPVFTTCSSFSLLQFPCFSIFSLSHLSISSSSTSIFSCFFLLISSPLSLPLPLLHFLCLHFFLSHVFISSSSISIFTYFYLFLSSPLFCLSTCPSLSYTCPPHLC